MIAAKEQKKRIIFFLPVLILAAGCSVLSDSGSTTQEEAIQTDQNTYTAGLERVQSQNRAIYGFKMIVRLENTTGEMIYLPYLSSPCHLPHYGMRSMSPDPKISSALRQVWTGSSSENPCHESVISFEPEAVRVDTLQVSGPFAWESDTNNFLGTLEGQFRLISPAGTCLEEGTNMISPNCRLPDSLVSNQFEVRLENSHNQIE